MKKKEIALVLYPGCILLELALSLEFLAKKFQICAYSPSGGPILTSFGTQILTRSFSEGPGACAAVLVPGGDFDSIKDNENLDVFLTKAEREGALVAAICGGVFALGKAGLLRGKKFVHPFGAAQMKVLAPFFAGGFPQEGKDFFHDGKLLTAMPYAHIDFAVELASRLEAIEPSDVIFWKNYHRGNPLGGRIRPLGLAIIQRANGQVLVHEGFDQKRKQKFYRPLGGGIEFGESARLTVERELEEEIGQKVRVGKELGVMENCFSFEGRPGHEIILAFWTEFLDPTAYSVERFSIDESGQAAGFCVWKSPAEAQAEGVPFYPPQLANLLLVWDKNS